MMTMTSSVTSLLHRRRRTDDVELDIITTATVAAADANLLNDVELRTKLPPRRNTAQRREGNNNDDR